MTHITLSVPNEVYAEMKKHPEIKWSEIARQSIIEKTQLLKQSIHGKDFLKLLSSETRKSIEKSPDTEGILFYKKTKSQEWKRKKYLTQA